MTLRRSPRKNSYYYIDEEISQSLENDESGGLLNDDDDDDEDQLERDRDEEEPDYEEDEYRKQDLEGDEEAMEYEEIEDLGERLAKGSKGKRRAAEIQFNALLEKLFPKQSPPYTFTTLPTRFFTKKIVGQYAKFLMALKKSPDSKYYYCYVMLRIKILT